MIYSVPRNLWESRFFHTVIGQCSHQPPPNFLFLAEPPRTKISFIYFLNGQTDKSRVALRTIPNCDSHQSPPYSLWYMMMILAYRRDLHRAVDSLLGLINRLLTAWYVVRLYLKVGWLPLLIREIFLPIEHILPFLWYACDDISG